MKTRKKKLEADEDFALVVKYWGYLPRRVKRAMADVARAFEPPPRGAVWFETPEGATWRDVEIVLVSPERVRVTVLGVTELYSYRGIGLADKRRPGTPRAEWKMLRTYAENPDPDAYYRLPRRPTLKMDISRFRAWLKAFFGIAGDPLKPFKPARWLPRFKIRVERT